MEQSCYDSYIDIPIQQLHARQGTSVWASSSWEAEQPPHVADTVPQALDYTGRVEYFQNSMAGAISATLNSTPIPKLHVVSSGLSQSTHYVNLPSSHMWGLTGVLSSCTGIYCR